MSLEISLRKSFLQDPQDTGMHSISVPECVCGHPLNASSGPVWPRESGVPCPLRETCESQVIKEVSDVRDTNKTWILQTMLRTVP